MAADTSILDILSRGGVTFYLLLGSLLATLLVAMERALALRQAGADVRDLHVKWKTVYRRGAVGPFGELCDRSGALGKILARALNARTGEAGSGGPFLVDGWSWEILRLERPLVLLGFLAAASPLIGAIGALLQMMSGEAGSTSGPVSRDMLALLAFGLVIGLVAFALYSLLKARLLALGLAFGALCTDVAGSLYEILPPDDGNPIPESPRPASRTRSSGDEEYFRPKRFGENN